MMAFSQWDAHFTRVMSGFPFSTTNVAISAPLPLPQFRRRMRRLTFLLLTRILVFMSITSHSSYRHAVVQWPSRSPTKWAKSIYCKCGIYLIDWHTAKFLLGAAPSLPATFNGPVEGLTVTNDAGPCGVGCFLRASLQAHRTIRSSAIREVTLKVIHQCNTSPTLHPVQKI